MEKERNEEGKKKEGGKEEGGREEEEDPGLKVWKLLIHVLNSCLEPLFCLEISYSCLELWFGTFVWICWLGNYPNSFFVYVWIRKTLTVQYMCILVGLSQF